MKGACQCTMLSIVLSESLLSIVPVGVQLTEVLIDEIGELTSCLNASL